MSTPRGCVLGRLDPKCQTRAFGIARTNAENDCVHSRLRVVWQLEPCTDRTRPPGVDHKRGRDKAQPVPPWPPFRLRRAGEGYETVSGARTAVIPNAERGQAIALTGAQAVDDPYPADVERIVLRRQRPPRPALPCGQPRRPHSPRR